MKTIREIFGKGKVGAMADVFGIELELEGVERHNLRVPPEWRLEEDGSLRDRGAEFVIKAPVGVAGMEKALKSLADSFKAANVVPKETNLASTHIHINVGDLSVEELLNLVGLIMVFEKDIAINGGMERYNNYFALTSSNAEEVHHRLLHINCTEDFVDMVDYANRRELRYSGINFASITKYGSLELRFLGAKPNPVDALPWVQFYANLKKFAKNEYIDFEQMFQDISVHGTKALEKMFNPPFKPDEGNIIVGIRNAQDIVFGTLHGKLCAPEGNGLRAYYNKL